MTNASTYYFYDLETTGLDHTSQRIVQFAGQRTDMNLEPIGEPFMTYVAVEESIVPDIQAVITTGISPQQANREGISELAFFEHLASEVFTPGTIAVGYNNSRFDDEFIRYGFWRNLFDPYSWAWKDGRSRWDVLPLVRMARALRPDGVSWPIKDDRNDNSLESLSASNKITHASAHDAMSDVEALISLAQLLKKAQPKLFEFLVDLRKKPSAERLLNGGEPIIHTSSNLRNAPNATSIMYPLAELQKRKGSHLLYDLRFDPAELANLTEKDIREQLYCKDAKHIIPLKTVSANKCPAIAPLGVFDAEAQKRNDLTIDQALTNLKKLRSHKGLIQKLVDAIDTPFESESMDVEDTLYGGGFLSNSDQKKIETIRKAVLKKEFSSLEMPSFDDQRIETLVRRFIGNNSPNGTHSAEVKSALQEHYQKRLTGSLRGMQSVEELVKELSTKKAEKTIDDFTYDELMLWANELLSIQGLD